MTDNTIDGELPDWVCMPDDGGSHLTTYTYGEISGCKDHPIAGGCSLPQPEFTNLIAQEANKARIDELKHVSTQGTCYYTDKGEAISINDRIAQLTADKEPSPNE